jgi:hypothetical protein
MADTGTTKVASGRTDEGTTEAAGGTEGDAVEKGGSAAQVVTLND